MTTDITIRRATAADLPAIVALQECSLRALHGAYYDANVIEAFVTHVGTMDPSLIDERTYFVAEAEERLIACGGWSTGQGAHHAADSATWTPEPKIRAVYVDPAAARQGIGRGVMAAIERDIAAASHVRIGLAAMLGAIPFYRRLGYAGSKPLVLRLPNDLMFLGLLMSKSLPLRDTDWSDAA